MILVVKTDTPEAYVALFQDGKQKAAKTWVAGRELSVQLLATIASLYQECDIDQNDVRGVIVYQGPGSYTGLRISISTANAIGSSLDIPVIGSNGELWLKDGFDGLEKHSNFTPVAPVYGGDVYTTKPRK